MNDVCNVESLPEWKQAPHPDWKRVAGPGCWYEDADGKLYWREGAVQDDWLSDLFEERAAIHEYDAGMTRPAAEAAARASVSK